MAPAFEQSTFVFIVRFWFEPGELKVGSGEWRFCVEHVPGGEKHYFRKLSDILIHMLSHINGQAHQ